MSDYIKGVQVGTEVKQYDYDALGNKPNLVEVDVTLSKSGQAADAKKVGEQFANTTKTIQDNANAIQKTNERITETYKRIDDLSDLVDKSFGVAICQDISGENISISDSADAPIQGIAVYGKSTRNSTPTLDTPADIESVENPVLRVCGKNLVDGNVESILFQRNAALATVIKNGNVFEMTTTNYGEGFIFGSGVFLRGVQYRISGNVVNCVNVRLYSSSNYTTQLANITVDENGNFDTVYTPQVDDAVFRVWVESGATCVLSNFQIAFEAVTQDFEPYKIHQTLTIPHTLCGVPVSSGGNYTDSGDQQWICDEVDFARGVYVQRIYDVPMADMEWIVEKTTETYYEYKTYSSTAKLENGQLYTSHFAKTDDNRAVVGSNRNIYVRFPISTGIDTAEKANDFFANNNVVALGVLLEPIETLLSENEITAYRAIHSNYPNTTFLNDDGAHIAVKYVADTKTYIDNKLAELLNA